MVLVTILGLAVAIGAVRMVALQGRLRRLEELTMTDPLTGAFNRRHLDVCLATAIERRSRTGEPASLLLFDVDRFKAINDSAGHAAGDGVLKALVALAGRRARKLDVLFRIGGEEFALLLSGARFADALIVAEDLRALVADAGLLDGGQVSISVGVSELCEGQSVQDWIEEADAALYRAKRGGRNRVAGRHSGAAARQPVRA
ncbi:MAG: GGDEF domain-containing protein [Betaproteobacteria bacterium]